VNKLKKYFMREKLEIRVLDTFIVTVGRVVVLQTLHKIMKDPDS